LNSTLQAASHSIVIEAQHKDDCVSVFHNICKNNTVNSTVDDYASTLQYFTSLEVKKTQSVRIRAIFH